jgi:signal transduction histidine kinase
MLMIRQWLSYIKSRFGSPAIRQGSQLPLPDGRKRDTPERGLHYSEQQFQELINKTSVAYSAIGELDQVFQDVVDWLVEMLLLDQSRIVLLDQAQETMRIVAEYARGKQLDQPIAIDQPILIGHSPLLWQLITSRAPLTAVVPTVDQIEQSGLAALFDQDVHIFMLVPLVVGADTIGLIYCASGRDDPFTVREMKLAQTVANLIATRIEQTRLFEAERQRRLEAETLQDATVSLTATINQNQQSQVLDNILNHLERVVYYDSASVFLHEYGHDDYDRDPDQETLSLVASRHFDAELVNYERHLKKRSPLFDLIRRNRQPIIIDDVHQDERFVMVTGFEYIRSWMGIPLIVHDKVIGYFGIDSKQVGAYTQHHALVAQAFANQAAAAIVNVRLFAQVQEQTSALRAVNESLRRENAERQLLEDRVQQSLHRRTEQVYISTEVAQEIAAAPALELLFRQVVNLVKDRFDYYHTQVYSLENDYLVMQEGTGDPGQMMKKMGHRISLSAEKGLVATAAITGRPALATDVNSAENWLSNPYLPETRSEIAVPIILKNEVLGVLDVQSNQVAGINEEDEILLLGLCGQIAVAINNRRLEDERVQVEMALKAYTVELERSNRELEDFAYVASHDLQEPLRKIQAFGSRLRQKHGAALDEGGLDYLNRMESAAARMQTLINDLLTFSRVTTRAQPFIQVDLASLVQVVLLDLEVKIAEVNGRMHVGTLPTIEADPTQMRQLLQNLISNALKFHREGVPPVVNISSEYLDQPPANLLGKSIPDGGYCRLSIADNGIGFDEKYAERIFTVFQRLHRRSQYEGTGVGLALCRKIVERHKGKIAAKSQVGQGATFIVILPIKQKND